MLLYITFGWGWRVDESAILEALVLSCELDGVELPELTASAMTSKFMPLFMSRTLVEAWGRSKRFNCLSSKFLKRKRESEFIRKKPTVVDLPIIYYFL